MEVARWVQKRLSRKLPNSHLSRWGDSLVVMAEENMPIGYSSLMGGKMPVRFPAGGLALLYLAERAVDQDRRRPVLAVDAGRPHNELLTGWGGIWKEAHRTRGHKPRVKEEPGKAWFELLGPGLSTQLALPFDEYPPHAQVVQAIKRMCDWEGLRNWAALLRLFSVEGGRQGWIRWRLDEHLEALGYAPSRRRQPETRIKAAGMVKLFTELELVEMLDGQERERRPLVLVGSRYERLRGSRWKLEGMELQANPLLYRGVRNLDTGKLGCHWFPTVPEVAQLDHRRYAPALMMGVILPIRWRWDVGERDHLALKGGNLLKLACIPFNKRKPARAWDKLERNLAKLGGIDALEGWEADDGGRDLEAVYRLWPPAWAMDRISRGVPVIEPRLVELPKTGAELRAWREKRGWTQKQLAEALGVNRSTVIRAEKGGGNALPRSITRRLSQV